MPILFKRYQATMKNKAGKRLFYPRVVCTGNVNTMQIAREIASYSSLSTGDVKNTLDNLVVAMERHLQASQSVTLDGFGTFSVGICAGGQGVEKEEDVSASKVRLKVRFRPASTHNPDRSVATRALLTGARLVRYESLESGASGGTTPPASGQSGTAPDPGA